MSSNENVLTDILQGRTVVSLTLTVGILTQLKEQIIHGGGPAWLAPEEQHHVAQVGGVGTDQLVDGDGNVDGDHQGEQPNMARLQDHEDNDNK